MVMPAPSLDHLRIFAAVVDAGSFSGAARALDRSQPAISYAIATMEGQLGFALFERGRRKPVLTGAGGAVLAYARRITLLADELAASAASVSGGLEGAVTVAIDSFFPKPALARALTDLAQKFPSVALDVRILSREQVLREVSEGRADFAVSMIDIAWPPGMEARDFGAVEIVAVAAPGHPLTMVEGPLPTMVMRDHVQITNRSAGTDEAHDISVNSARLWRVDDLQLHLMLLREGVGWSYLPMHLAAAEIAAGRLVRLAPATHAMARQPWSLFHRSASPPGPARRYLGERLDWHADYSGDYQES